MEWNKNGMETIHSYLFPSSLTVAAVVYPVYKWVVQQFRTNIILVLMRKWKSNHRKKTRKGNHIIYIACHKLFMIFRVSKVSQTKNFSTHDGFTWWGGRTETEYFHGERASVSLGVSQTISTISNLLAINHSGIGQPWGLIIHSL